MKEHLVVFARNNQSKNVFKVCRCGDDGLCEHVTFLGVIQQIVPSFPEGDSQSVAQDPQANNDHS